MNNYVYLDTSVILSILLETEKYEEAENILTKFQSQTFVTSGIALNESFYVASFEYYKSRNRVKGKHSLREIIGKNGYPREVIDMIMGFINDLNIRILNDYFDFDEYIQIMTKYKMLPNDAQIAMTCKYYSIHDIITFDKDFKRIPWLRVLP